MNSWNLLMEGSTSVEAGGVAVEGAEAVEAAEVVMVGGRTVTPGKGE